MGATLGHPCAKHVTSLATPEASAKSLGYQMPAEWETQKVVWVAPPQNAETWPGALERAQKQFDEFLSKLRRVTTVRHVGELKVTPHDSWIRDFGPIFVRGSVARNREQPRSVNNLNALAIHDFHFDAWGGKYEPRDRDDVIPQHVAARDKLPIWIHDMVLEGGAIEVNGQGTVMSTTQCLLESGPNGKGRNPHMSRERLEDAIHDALGTCQMNWLPGGIVGDDTDGHIDDVARFLGPGTVAAVSPAPGHPDYAMGQRNLQALRQATDQDGERLHLIELPAPEPMHFDFPADRFQPGGRAPLPASYANFLISNGHVFVPTFNQRRDEAAMNVLDQAMPGFTIEPVPCDWLVVGLGTLHCLTMQQPGA